MTGWKLFRHSFSMISSDVGAAFRVTGLPYAIIVVITLMFPQTYGIEPEAVEDVALWGLLALPAYFAAWLWLAVQWHRYVLTGEIQSGAVPFWHVGPILSYLWRSIIIGVLAVLVFLAVGFPAGFVGAATQSPAIVVILTLFAAALGLAILGRFSPILPAAAIGRKLSLREAWRATSGATGAILVMAVLLTLLSSIPVLLSLIGLEAVVLISNLAFQWLISVLSICLMTTLYGHYVEGRALA